MTDWENTAEPVAAILRVLKRPNMESWKRVAYSGIVALSAPLFAQLDVSLDLDCFKGPRHYLKMY